jgi:hypothetical protein
MRTRKLVSAIGGVMVCLSIGVATADETGGAPATRKLSAPVARPLRDLLSVGREGTGNAEAAKAWRELAAAQPKHLTDVLTGLDQAEPLAANWIALAAETIAQRAEEKGQPLPDAALKRFVLDTTHAPRARRLAFEFLSRADGETARSLVPSFLHDPSAELRREAVERLIAQATASRGDGDEAALHGIYRQAFSGACDLDQVKLLKGELEKLGDKVDLARHFGFITTWKLIGPFDNSGERGFGMAEPPERETDFAGSYAGKPREGQPRDVQWTDHTTADEYGTVDLNKAIVKENGVTAYAWAEFWSDEQRPAELRLGGDNAVKIWLNGELLHEHAVYHSGSEMDGHIGHGTLRAGRNTILVKICQNEQQEDWAQNWGFQLRVCDRAGQAIDPGQPAEPDAANPDAAGAVGSRPGVARPNEKEKPEPRR